MYLRLMVWAAGLEPAASAFQVRHSTKLSYAQGIRFQSAGRGRSIVGGEITAFAGEGK